MDQARPWLFLGLLLAACADSATDPDPAGVGDGRHRIDFAAQSGGTLAIANETVALSLGLADDPGDAMLLYTRLGCTDDPDGVIGSGGDSEARLPPTQPVHLTYVAVEQKQVASSEPEPAVLGEQTCFSYRTSNGQWQPTFRPFRSTVRGDSVVVEAVLDVHDADALAIFLNTYTNLVSITYEAVSDE